MNTTKVGIPLYEATTQPSAASLYSTCYLVSWSVLQEQKDSENKS